MMGTRSPQDKLFAADTSISILLGGKRCAAIWRKTGDTCSGMKTSPSCTGRIVGGLPCLSCAKTSYARNRLILQSNGGTIIGYSILDFIGISATVQGESCALDGLRIRKKLPDFVLSPFPFFWLSWLKYARHTTQLVFAHDFAHPHSSICGDMREYCEIGNSIIWGQMAPTH
jgi:hypothetical protein